MSFAVYQIIQFRYY